MQDSSRPATGYPYPNPNHPPAVNGYPPAQPGPAYGYQNPYQAHAQVNPHHTLLRRLMIAFIAFVIVICTIFLISILVLRPRRPVVFLTSVSVSNFNANATEVTGKWSVGFQVGNPNKKLAFSYEGVICSIFHDGEFMAETQLPPFIQGTRDQTAINATLSADATYVDADVVNDINKERASGSIKFDVKLGAWLGYKYRSYGGRKRAVRVFCYDVPVGVSSKGSGNLVGAAKECRVI